MSAAKRLRCWYSAVYGATRARNPLSIIAAREGYVRYKQLVYSLSRICQSTPGAYAQRCYGVRMFENSVTECWHKQRTPPQLRRPPRAWRWLHAPCRAGMPRTAAGGRHRSRERLVIARGQRSIPERCLLLRRHNRHAITVAVLFILPPLPLVARSQRLPRSAPMLPGEREKLPRCRRCHARTRMPAERLNAALPQECYYTPSLLQSRCWRCRVT